MRVAGKVKFTLKALTTEFEFRAQASNTKPCVGTFIKTLSWLHMDVIALSGFGLRDLGFIGLDKNSSIRIFAGCCRAP